MNEITNYSKLKNKYKDEQVFIIPYANVADINDKFTRVTNEQDTIWTKYDSVGKYIFRYDAEGNNAVQQLIPYILIQNESTGEFFVTKRIKGEPRLVDQLSLGIGGHINPCDGAREALFKGLVRELLEEVYIEVTTRANFVGYMRDITSSTNDHFGCVFLIKAKEVRVRETDKLEGLWMSIDQLEDNYFKFEGWARYIIDYISENKKF